MVTFLEVSTVLFQMSFADAALFLWDGGQLLSLVDAVFCVVASFTDFFWFKQYESSLEFIEANVVRYCMLIGYIAAHIWSTTVKPRHRYWKKATLNDGVLALERLKHVLICRSTALASELLPIMNEMWGALVECWEKNARAACLLEIYITGKDEAANEQLRREMENTAVFHSGAIYSAAQTSENNRKSHTQRDCYAP
jgi:hypothetical protein